MIIKIYDLSFTFVLVVLLFSKNTKRPFARPFILRNNSILYFLSSSISSCIDLILSLNSWLIFPGIFLTFLKSRASIMEAIPMKMKRYMSLSLSKKPASGAPREPCCGTVPRNDGCPNNPLKIG